MQIVTGCQDGLMRLYETCQPESAPTEFRISPSGTDEAITKLSWSKTNPNLVIIGKRSGVVEIWDIRSPSGAVASQEICKGVTIMDLEINVNHGNLVVACGQKVRVKVIYF